MTNFKLLLAGFVTASAMAFGGTSHAAVISQISTTTTGNSGTGNYGQAVEVDSGLLTENILTGLSMQKGLSAGGNGGGTTTGYIDVYSLGSADFSTLNFGTGTEVGNLTYLGSSTNSFDTLNSAWVNATTYNFNWTFDNIVLPFDTPVFFVYSDDDVAGSFVGTSMRLQGTAGNQVHTNINAADSYTLAFGGGADVAKNEPNDHEYIVTLTANVVPEPASVALWSILGLGLACFGIYRRRRK